MMNKKGLFAVALLAALGLGACGETGESSTPEESITTSETEGSTPVDGADWVADYEEEGKMFFYFQLGTKAAADGAAALTSFSSWVSPFVTGAFNAFAEADAPEMKAVEGHDGYYGVSIDWTYDPTTATDEKPYDYQLTLGYNSTSGAPKLGIDWTFKSNEISASYGPVDNPNWQAGLSESGLSINLGSHSWSAEPPKPVILEDYTREFFITDGTKDGEGKYNPATVPSYVTLRIAGSMNGWDDGLDSTTNVLTPVEGKAGYYTYNFGDVVKQSAIEFKVVATSSVSSDFWANSADLSAVTTTEGGNATFVAIAADDITESGPLTMIFSTWPADPADVAPIDVTIKVTLTDYVEGNVTVNGSFDAWTDGGIAMTAVEGEDKAYTATLEGVNAPGKVEFQFRVKNGTDIKYVGATAGEDGSQPNLVLNLLPADDGTTKAYTGTIATGVALAA